MALTKCPSLVDVLDMKEPALPSKNRKQRRTTPREQLTEAQQLVRKRIPATVSLVADLIAERREEARREADQH
jgi:hypothetical protein